MATELHGDQGAPISRISSFVKCRGQSSSKKIVVATIISHGMPYPTNVEMANEVEAIVRACQAAFTIADDPEVTLEANPNSAEAARFIHRHELEPRLHR